MLSVAGAILVAQVLAVAIGVISILRVIFKYPPVKLLPPMPLQRLPNVDFYTLPPSGSVYRYEDFVEDLKNPSISIELIIAKCGGLIPVEWGNKIAAVVRPPDGPPSQEDRAKVRQDWFRAASTHTPILKVVPAPAMPAPVPAIKAWVVHCKVCINNATYLMGGHRHNTCRWCKGTGFVTITGG